MVFEDGFCFLLFASRFALRRRMGGFFYLFLVVKDRALPTYLAYMMTTNRHIYPSPTHSRHSFIILAFSYTFTVLILGFSLPLPTLHEKDVEAFIRTSVEAKFPSHAYVQHQVFLLAIDLQPLFFPLRTREK